MISKIVEKINIDKIESVHILKSIAYSLYEHKNADYAYPFSNQLVKLEPNDPNYLDTHACILSQLGKNEDAKRYFLDAIQKGTKENITWNELKNLLTRRGESELYNKLSENQE